MKRAFRFHRTIASRARLHAVALGLLLGFAPTRGAQYQIGELLPDILFDRHESADIFHLSDFAGKVVVLDWFAHWCPFCQQAAEPIRGMMQQYQTAGGNVNGVPVALVALNLVTDEDAPTDAFISAHGLEIVADDTDRLLASRFRTGGQPIFAVINGVASSPTHKPNELVLSYLGFDNTTIGTLQTVIDSVKPAGAAAAPRLYSNLRADEPMSYGGTLTLRIEALGSPPFHYQWFKDSKPIPAGTGDSWTIANARDADAGDYYVKVSNDQGQVDSQTARVTVQPPPAFVGFQFDANHQAIIGMSTKAGRTYQLQGSLDLSAWSALGEFMAAGAVTAVRDAESATLPRRFYRLVER